MGTTSDTLRFVLPDNLNQDWLIPYAFNNTGIAVGIGDLMYYKGDLASVGQVAYPADQLATMGTEVADQAQFGSQFCGISQNLILSTETNVNKRLVTRTTGVAEFKCPSQTFKKGALVGIFSNGITIDPQQVDALQAGGVAIGMVFKDYLVATTRVRIVYSSRFSGLVLAGGLNPPGEQTMFGGATFGANFSYFGEEGNLYRNIGNPVAANAADTTDDILDGFQLPAGSFDVAKRGIQLMFQGKFGATANNKKVRLWVNPTMAGQTITNGVISGGTVTGAGAGLMLYDSTAQTGNGVGWGLLAQLFKYGAAGSNTQYFQIQPIFGTTHGGITLPTFATMAENAAMNFVLTGSSSTTGAANDVVLNISEANAMN